MKIVNIICKVIPGVKWLKEYNVQYAVSDLIAGLTVGLTVLPQGLAYATLAGLEPQYGLYSAFMGGVIYAFLGGCRQVTIGPTALLALMTSKHTGLGLSSGPAYAVLLCFMSGVMELVMAMLNLGALVDLISLPVTVGFTSATAVIIAASQLKGLLGLNVKSGSGFINTIKTVYTNLEFIRVGDFSLGILSIIFLLLMRKLKDVKLTEGVSGYKLMNGIFWLISTARNALVVLISSSIAFEACQDENCMFILTGKVKSGLPDFNLPQFSTTVRIDNKTEIHQNLTEMVNELGSSIIILPIIAVLGNVAISKAFGGSSISPTRELIALSLSNICGSFFSSMPVTGSFSRSAVNHASGVKSPIGGIYTSILVLLALSLLAPYFSYIPKAALSAVIISAVMFMIEFEVVKPLWRCSRRELLPGAITFIFSLAFGVEVGLLLGVASDLAFLVYRAARPSLSVSKAKTSNGIDYILVRPSHSSVYFPAIEWLRTGISRAISSFGVHPVILDCSNMYDSHRQISPNIVDLDFTAARGLGSVYKDLSEIKAPFYFVWKKSCVRVNGAKSTPFISPNIVDLDFTAARGLGSVYKDLSEIKAPFYLLSPSKEIVLILKESTETNFPGIDTVEELESMLEQIPNCEYYLQVAFPLIEIDGDHNKSN